MGVWLQVLGGIAHHGSSGGHVGSNKAGVDGNMLLGNLCLLINTLAMATYYILAKQVQAQKCRRWGGIGCFKWQRGAFRMAGECSNFQLGDAHGQAAVP